MSEMNTESVKKIMTNANQGHRVTYQNCADLYGALKEAVDRMREWGHPEYCTLPPNECATCVFLTRYEGLIDE